MFRKLFLCLVMLIVTGATLSCKNDNTVTGPSPLPAMTPTPMPGVPTPMPTRPPTSQAIVNVGQGGGLSFVDQRSGTSTTTVHAGDSVHWVWVSGTHSTTSGSCSGAGCQPDGLWDSGIGSAMTFTHTFNQVGMFGYFCEVHGVMMQGTVVVQ